MKKPKPRRSSKASSPSSAKVTRRSRTKTARRSDKYAKGWATRRANSEAREAASYAESINAERQTPLASPIRRGINRRLDETKDAMAKAMFGDNSPGHGEIVGGAEYQLTEEIMALARKKGGKDAIQNKITERIAVARAEGQILADRNMVQTAKRTHEAHSDKVVCGALATWEMAMTVNGGLPSTCVVSGYTVARIMDVLNRLGYSGNGRSNQF